MNNVIIEKTFEVAVWDEITRQKTIDYWSGKRFKFTETSSDTMFAKRGRWIGNLISSDMSYLMATLMIGVASNTISCRMEINTILQKRSEWDMTWWKLEMRTFESFLLRGDEQKELWKQFKVDHKTAVLLLGARDPSMFGMSTEHREKYQ